MTINATVFRNLYFNKFIIISMFYCFKTVITYTTMTNRKEHPKFHQTALEDE